MKMMIWGATVILSIICAGCSDLSQNGNISPRWIDPADYPGTAKGELNGEQFTGRAKLRSYVNEDNKTVYSLNVVKEVENYVVSLDLVDIAIGSQQFLISDSMVDSLDLVIGQLYTVKEGDATCSKYTTIQKSDYLSGQLSLDEPFDPSNKNLIVGCFSVSMARQDLRTSCVNVLNADTLNFESVCFQVPVQL